MEQTKRNLTDEEVNEKFRTMLRAFNSLIKDQPAASKVKEELQKMQSEAMKSNLTSRQISAIYERCANYLNGSYGQNLSVCK